MSKQYPSVEVDKYHIDILTAQFVLHPDWFDVVVASNLFGDILSDLGAGLMGGLGLAPSADIGLEHAVFQPCHGSAPDIAGQGLANPFAMILSAAMMLDWLGTKHHNANLIADAQRLRAAVDAVVSDGTTLTRDLGGVAGTQEAAQAVAKRLFGS